MVAGGAIIGMGMLWYIGAILVWCVVAGVIGGGLAGFGSALAMTAFFYLPWWLPFITWMAFGEAVLSLTKPDRRVPFFVFAAFSLLIFSVIACIYPKWSELWPLLVFPAAAVTITYIFRHITR